MGRWRSEFWLFAGTSKLKMRIADLSKFVGFCVLMVCCTASSSYAQDITRLGGDLTSDLPGRSAIQVNAPNVTDETRRLIQLGGFSIFHGVFDRSHGLGPNFNNASCGGCHIDNGRGPTRFSKSNVVGSKMVVKISLPGLLANGAPRNVPGVGEQLLDHNVRGAPKVEVNLSWKELSGAYPDGTKYKLRRPILDYRIRGMNRRKLRTSLRMTPMVIGPGLIEAIPDQRILEYSDPDDADGDGISGHPNYVPSRRTGTMEIGRFGFRGSHPTVEQQSCGALVNDIGITNPIFFDSNAAPEFTEDQLTLLTLYQTLAGVPPASNQDDSRVIAGKSLFQSIGCNKCHRMTMNTDSYKDPELSNQEFHPFTDLLLHDMGSGLADKRDEFSAKGSEWRTSALWGLGFSRRLAGGKTVYLHDGRARTIEEAILWHGGESEQSRDQFMQLPKDQRDDLLAFLDSL